MAMRRELWRLWQSSFEQIVRGPGGASAEEGLKAAWRQFGFDPGAADSQMDAFTTLINSWFGAAPDTSGPEVFSQMFNQRLQDLLRGSFGGTENQKAPFDFMNEFLGSPLRMWQSGLGQGHDPFDVASWSGVAPLELTALPDLPPLGLTREWETAWRELCRAYSEQIDAGNALTRQIGFIYHEALKRFAKAIGSNDIEDGEITSLRELYDLWVSIAEQAYAEKVMTTAYSQTFGNFINASARYRKARQALTDDVQEMMNLPNRRELNSVIERQHAMQAELRALGSRMANDIDMDALKRRVEALSLQLEGFAAAPSKESMPATAKKRRKTKVSAAPATRIVPGAKRKSSTTKRRAAPPTAEPSAAGEFDIDGFAADDRG